MSENAAIRVENVSKQYRLYPTPASRLFEAVTGRARHSICQALDGVSFEVSWGQTIGIIGRNGSGKSTLLHILAGIIDPSGGSFEVRGKAVPLLELGAGFVPALTGIDNIMLNGRLLGLSKREVSDRVEAVLDFAELGEFAYQPVRTYSAGMQLRLGFAIAQSIEPDILLVDEVLSVGDIAFANKCLARIKEFRARGATVLLVTHSLADVGGLCDRVIQLAAGRVVREGPMEEVVRAYMDDIQSGRQASAGVPLWRMPTPHSRKTGEITVGSVDLLSSGGEPTDFVATGEGMCVRICFKVRKPVKNPMFRLQVFRADGLFVHGTNTYRQGMDMGVIDEDGCIEVRYEEVNLLEGHYFAGVGIYPDEYGKAMADSAYDLVEPALSFEVRSGRPDGAGVTAMAHKWEWPA